MKVRKGDNVMMLVGKDRGKSGKIIRSFPKEEKLVIEGLNLVKRHRRARRQGQKGEIISVPRKISSSSVMLICSHCKKPSRMGVKHENGKMVRICKKCVGEN